MNTMRSTAIFLLIATAAFAADKVQTVQASGEAAIVGADVQAKVKAREQAKKTGLRNAVETASGTMVTAFSLTRDNTLVSDRIFSNAQGYVKNVRDEKYAEKDGIVSYTATVDVHSGAIEKDLMAIRELVRSLHGKKLVIVLQEQSIDTKGTVISSGVMTQVLTDAFKNDGWIVLDPAFAAGKLQLASGVGRDKLDKKEIGDLSKADYILYGQTNFRHQEPGPFTKGIYLVAGEWTLQVFETATGSQLAQLAGKFDMDLKKLTGDKKPLVSYERTSYELARSESTSIIGQTRGAVYKYLANARQNGSRLVLEVVGLEDLGQVEDFKVVLADRTGVSEVGEPDFADGRAKFEVTYVGSTSDLARQFIRTTFQKKKVKVTGKTNNLVQLTVAK